MIATRSSFKFFLVVAALALCVRLHSAETLKTAIAGDTLSINGGETKLGASHWAKPEESWRTVGELAKSALPPPNKQGRRDVLIVVEVDAKASWGALKTLLLACANLGAPKAEIHADKSAPVLLELPGAKEGGNVVEFPLSLGTGDELMVENGGQKFPCTAALVAAMAKQVKGAIIAVRAPVSLPAAKVVRVLDELAKAKATINFLPIREQTANEAADQKDAKDAVDRALQGGMGGLGGLGGGK